MSKVWDTAWSVQAHVLHLPGGKTITVRPIRSQDADRLQVYVRDLRLSSRRNRFLGALSELACLHRRTRRGRLVSINLARFAGLHWRRPRMRVIWRPTSASWNDGSPNG
jgi:hypothetical protein